MVNFKYRYRYAQGNGSVCKECGHKDPNSINLNSCIIYNRVSKDGTILCFSCLERLEREDVRYAMGVMSSD